LLIPISALSRDVVYNFDDSVDFSKFKTYKWVTLEKVAPIDELTDERIKATNRNKSRVRAKVEHTIGIIKRIFGFQKVGTIEQWVPLFLFSVLFGLSMDYQVFLVSRMHEEWAHTGDNERAVIQGQVASGRVISAAAAIMISVFAAFVLGGQRLVAEFGVGLAVAVCLDAFVLRSTLVPAVMHLFGRANWWLPRRVERRMPHLSVDPSEMPEEAAP